MKCFISYIIFFFLCFGGFAQSKNYVLPYNGESTLNDYLTSIMHTQYAARKKTLKEALKSVENLETYQRDCRKRYINLLTNFSNNITDTLPKVSSSGNYIDFTSCTYYIEKLILNNRITANLYIPRKEGTKPAILFFCGHEMTGKSTDSYQKTAILLAQNGFIVMVIDPIGQGERIQLIDSTGNSLTPRATSEHTILNMSATLTGWSLTEEELLDNFLCMNYLCSLRNVDKNNIGCIGNSGGGAQASYFSALDKRIKAVACCSWFTKRERMFTIYGPDDGCQYLANEGREQLEIADYYIMQAPRPTLILAGTKDFIDYQGTEEAFKELKAVFKLLQRPDDAILFSVKDEHGISQPKREAAVQFFNKYLKKENIIKENNIEVLSDSALRCTKSGQIAIDFSKEETLQTRILKRVDNSCTNRLNFVNQKLDSNQIIVKKLLNIPEKLEPIQSKTIGKVKENKLYIEKKIILRRNGHPEIPIRLLTPSVWKSNAEVFIILNDSGMSASLKLLVVEKILQNGNAVILADPRGIGETKDTAEKNNKKYYSEDYRNAGLALFIGYPLLGQRVIDIFTLLDFISAEKTLQGKPINCFGYSNIGVAIIHASYLDNRIIHTATKECIASWIDILQHPTEKNRMSLILPNGLKYYDINLLRKPIEY